jgi:hypothetical protein
MSSITSTEAMKKHRLVHPPHYIAYHNCMHTHSVTYKHIAEMEVSHHPYAFENKVTKSALKYFELVRFGPAKVKITYIC